MFILKQPSWKKKLQTTGLRLTRAVAFCASLLAVNKIAQATESVTLAWDPSPDPYVAGYYLCCGGASGVYTNKLDVGMATTSTVTGLAVDQTYYFAVTAYNQAHLESIPSTEIAYTVPARLVAWLRLLRKGSLPSLRFVVAPTNAYDIQVSGDLRSWTTIKTGVSLSTNWIEWTDPQGTALPQRFYRLLVR